MFVGVRLSSCFFRSVARVVEGLTKGIGALSTQSPRGRGRGAAFKIGLDRFRVRPVWLLPLIGLIGALGGSPVSAADSVPSFTLLETKSDVRFGIWGETPASPAPTLFILASTIEETLGNAYFRQSGNVLAPLGFLCVSIDLPAHGPQQRADEPPGLEGWRHRTDRGGNFVAEVNGRLAQVLDHLIAIGYTDATKVAICGTSRGGFLAMHFAAFDSRVRCVAVFAPVTELTALREFHGAEGNAVVSSLALVRQADKLARAAVWIIIGGRDERVGTDHAISLARRITAAASAQGLPGRTELHVMPEARGHTTPKGGPAQAAAWIRRQIETKPVAESENHSK